MKASASRRICALHRGRAVLDRALDLIPQLGYVLMFVDGDLIAANTANGTVRIRTAVGVGLSRIPANPNSALIKLRVR
jgi:hypothetical protein